MIAASASRWHSKLGSPGDPPRRLGGLPQTRFGRHTCPGPPEYHKLAGRACDGSGQGILGKSRSHRNEQAQSSLGRIIFRIANRRIGICPQDPHSKRIGEDTTTLQHLVGCAMAGCSQRGTAWLSLLHRNYGYVVDKMAKTPQHGYSTRKAPRCAGGA